MFEKIPTAKSIVELYHKICKYFLASDEELFEDNPEEYTRRDIEGSDVDTRRRAACDLVNTLSLHFEQRIMEIFGKYLQVNLDKNVVLSFTTSYF